MRAAEGGDDAHGHRLADAERVADGEHDVADAQAVHLAEGDGGELVGLDLQDREVGFGVAADDVGLVGLAVVERNLDVVGFFDDMEIGQDVAVGADDDAGAETGVALRLSFRAVAEEVAEDRVVEQWMSLLLDFLRGVNVHDRGQGRPGCIAVGAGWRGLRFITAGGRFPQRDDTRACR